MEGTVYVVLVAPFGRGEDTVVDESVRKCVQLAPQKLVFANDGFNLTSSDSNATGSILQVSLFTLLFTPRSSYFLLLPMASHLGCSVLNECALKNVL